MKKVGSILAKGKPQKENKVNNIVPPDGNPIVVKRKKRGLSLQGKRSLAGFLFVLPFILGLFLFFLPALIQAVVFTFNEVRPGINGYELVKKGYDIYRYVLFEEKWYTLSLVESLKNMGLSVPLVLIFSFFMASVLNQKFRGRGFFRAILFLPVVISAGVVLKLDNLAIFTSVPESAVTADAISALDLVPLLVKLGMPNNFINTISGIIASIYEIITASGVQILIFLAAMQTIPASLYEASTMDGATGWENFWKITFPMLSPYILSNAVYTIVDNLGSLKSPIMRHIVSSASGTNSNLSQSITMAVVFFACQLLVIAVITVLISRLVFYYD